VGSGLIKRVRKIATERDTTLTGMVRAYLEQTVAQETGSGSGGSEREALERSFETLQFHVGKPAWKRSDL
jgi:hypothetical protein